MKFQKSPGTASALSVIFYWLGLSSFAMAADLPDQNSLGSEWTLVGSSDQSLSFINLRTIRTSGQFVKAWVLHTNSGTFGGQTYQSSKGLHEYDCAREEYHYLSNSYFSEPYGRGQAIYTDGRPSQWLPIVPGSVGERHWQFLCGIHQLQVIGSDQWTKVDDNSKGTFYAAQFTKRHHGSIATLVVLNNYHEPITHDDGIHVYSDKGVSEFDCSKRSMRNTYNFVEYAEEMGRGAVVHAGSFSESNNFEWYKVNEGTVGGTLWTFACKKR